MKMNVDRLKPVLDVSRTQSALVTLVGAGASAGLARSLTRCGVRRWNLVDFDHVEAANIARQGHHPDQIGLLKVEALKQDLQRINPQAEVHTLSLDLTALSVEEALETFEGTDLFLFLTDSFQAQAYGNQIALAGHTPAIWGGLYQGGRGGEVAFWHQALDCCFRCLCAARYAAQSKALAEGRSLDPASEGATVFDVQVVDAIVGHLSLGLLTRGADNRFGQLIETLDTRQFLQVGLTPNFHVHGKDILREKLGVAEDCDAFFAWNTIALRDPDGGNVFCPDCVQFRGHQFVEQDGETLRIKPGSSSPLSVEPLPADAGSSLSI